MSTLPRTSVATGNGTWENEGGALAHRPSSELPDGITAIFIKRYRVGKYTYTNLNDAMAEYRRQVPGD